MSPIKNQSVQFTSSKKEFWHICNSSEQKIANRQTQTFLKINRARKKVSRLKDENVEKTKFTFLLYSRLPPRQYMTRVWPIKGGLYLLGASFWSQIILIYLKKLLSDYNIYIQYINTLVISSRFQIYVQCKIDPAKIQVQNFAIETKVAWSL